MIPRSLRRHQPPVQIVSVTLVGIGVFPDEILQDDADRTSRFLVTPALSRSLTPVGNYGLQGLILKHGNNDVRAFLDHLAKIVPIGDVDIRLTSVDEANALTATHPIVTRARSVRRDRRGRRHRAVVPGIGPIDSQHA